MPKLSIIVPIYNVEPYLSRCIDSILDQTYADFELILINDGSPDRCGGIIEEYAKKDERIVTIHQENKGVSAARNAGLKISKGKYIGFVDPDDYVDAQCYQKMIFELEDTGADIVCCNWNFVHEDGSVTEHVLSNCNGIMTLEKFLEHMFDSPRTIGGSNWNKLFLREKIVTLYDEEVHIGEDWLFLMVNSLQVEKACVVNEPLYHVYERKGSATRQGNSKMIYGLLVARKIIQLAGEVNKSLRKLAEKDYLDTCYRLYVQLKNDDFRGIDVVKKPIKEYMNQHLVSVMLNKEIFWKTRLLYLVKYIVLSFE